jgi:hypothetical protein
VQIALTYGATRRPDRRPDALLVAPMQAMIDADDCCYDEGTAVAFLSAAEGDHREREKDAGWPPSRKRDRSIKRAVTGTSRVIVRGALCAERSARKRLHRGARAGIERLITKQRPRPHGRYFAGL